MVKKKSKSINKKFIVLGIVVLIVGSVLIFEIINAPRLGKINPVVSNNNEEMRLEELRENVDQKISERLKNDIDIERQRPSFELSGNPAAILGEPGGGKDCAVITQGFLDSLYGDLYLNFDSGCYEITENVEFDYTIVLQGGDDNGYFTCNDYTIYPKTSAGEDGYGIYVYDNHHAKNCRVYGKLYGFVVYDNGKVSSSVADSGYYGFSIHSPNEGNSDNLAINNEEEGFFVMDSGTLRNSESIDNFVGFYLSGDAEVYNCIASNNYYDGFSVHDNSVIIGSRSNGNYCGYYVFSNNVEIYTSTAYDNQFYGFGLEGGHALDCISWGNDYIGFFVYEGGYVEGCDSYDNENYGFVFYNGYFSDIKTYNNGYDGALMFWNSDGYNLKTRNNGASGVSAFDNSFVWGVETTGNDDYGVSLTDNSVAGGVSYSLSSNGNGNGIYVGSDLGQGESSMLEGSGTVCYNDGYNIFVNGGTVVGEFKSTPIQGGGNWQGATIIPCDQVSKKTKPYQHY
ncbi:MAG: hypothetical protein ABIH25_04825 [Candidatus Woesearchaeota archaeon]